MQETVVLVLTILLILFILSKLLRALDPPCALCVASDD